MAVIEQARIPSGTLKLKRLKNDTDVSDNRYKYVVEYPDGDRTDPRFAKNAAMREFNRVKNVRQTSETSSSGSSGGGFISKLGRAGLAATGAAKQIGQGGSNVMEDIESGKGIDPLGLDSSDKSDSMGMDDLDMDLSEFD